MCTIENLEKKRVLILHGWQGSPFPHWQAHLENDLKEIDYEVSFPNLPDENNPKLDLWINALDIQMKAFKPHIVVCHSLGNMLWFHYVNQNKMNYTLEKLMLVSPVSNKCDIKELDTFFPYPLPLDLKATTKIMASSDNDEFISVDELYELSNKLNIGLKILEGAGHINTNSGYGKLSCAYDWVVA